jgi:hypothetical protein
MKKIIQQTRNKKVFTMGRFLTLSIGILILFGNSGYSQEIRWLHVGQLQSPINEIGAEYEGEIPSGANINNFFSWPAQYSIDQTTTRMKGLWIGCKNFNDPVENKLKSVKVIQSGPRDFPDRPNQIFPVEIKSIAKDAYPDVSVDNTEASDNIIYDLVDEFDPTLPADRMVLVRFNTSIGISVTKKVLAFANSAHGNYFINDYVFKNTGIYDRQGNVLEQTLQDVWFYFFYRYAFAGVTSLAYGSTWGHFNTTWGPNTINHSFGEDPNNPEYRDFDGDPMRGFFSWAGPFEGSPRPSYAEDWGTPKLDEPDAGTLGTAKYAGCVTLHADTSPKSQNDDIYQPKTTWFIASDGNHVDQNVSQYNESEMQTIYDIMSEGQPTTKHDVLVDDDYPFNYGDPARQNGGGTSQGQGYGPYTLEYGDSIHIIFAEGVSGISWEKGREVGNNWLQWRNGTGQPQLIMPDGSTTTDYNLYKRRWVETGKDSIIKTFRNAVQNYKSGYIQSPPPPRNFTITSGGDRIKLEWNAVESSKGYVIYRSRGNVLQYSTVYQKIFETNDPNVTSFDDVTASRGFDYYYYIQSKGDGTLSSSSWTVTNTPATLQRPAITGSPSPPNDDTTHWKLINPTEWVLDSTYSPFASVTYLGLTYLCISTIDTLPPDSNRTYWKQISLGGSNWISYRGEWVSGAAYNAFDIVTYNGADFVAPYSISGGMGLELVRVVPNPYDIRGRYLQFGDQSQYDRIAFYGLPPVCKLKIFTERGDLIWEKDHVIGTGDELWDSKTTYGQIVASGIYILYVETPDGRSVFRKFVIIR